MRGRSMMARPILASLAVAVMVIAAGHAERAIAREQTPTASPARVDPKSAPPLSLALELHVQVGAPMEVGTVPRGRRRIIPILGGTFSGSGIKGTVLPGGADWQIVRADGFAELDTRYALRTDSGDLIYIQNAGVRHAPPDITARLLAGQDVDPALVYFRTIPTFETAAPALQWLTRSIFIGMGERHPQEVVIRVWRVE